MVKVYYEVLSTSKLVKKVKFYMQFSHQCTKLNRKCLLKQRLLTARVTKSTTKNFWIKTMFSSSKKCEKQKQNMETSLKREGRHAGLKEHVFLIKKINKCSVSKFSVRLFVIKTRKTSGG